MQDVQANEARVQIPVGRVVGFYHRYSISNFDTSGSRRRLSTGFALPGRISYSVCILFGVTMSRYRISFGLVAACAAALAQSSGTLTGIITDPSQSNLPGVSLALTNEATGVTERAASNTQGEHTFPLLQPGRYRLMVDAKGFRPDARTGIVLESARVSRLDVKMEIGQVNEVVEVSASTPRLESESSTVGQFIEHKTVVDMPLTGRRVGELLASGGNT